MGLHRSGFCWGVGLLMAPKNPTRLLAMFPVCKRGFPRSSGKDVMV